MGNHILLSEEYMRPLIDDASAVDETRAALASIVRSSALAVISISRHGRVTGWNPGAEALYGFEAAEMLGHKPGFLFRDDSFLRDAARSDRVLDDARGVHRYEARHYTRGGEALEVAVAVSVLHGREGARRGAVAVISDITERKRAEQEIARARAAAEEAERLKAAIIANLSHEIRTPLNIILGYAEVISDYFDGKGDLSQRDALAAIMRAGDRLCSTVQDVLDLSKIESGGFQTRPARIELERMLERHLAAFASAARRKGLEFECLVELSGVVVTFDEYCLTRALAILLDNALKFTERGRIAVRVALDARGTLCLDVSDSGIGIAASHLPQLFEAFSQQNAGDVRCFEGLGLGLALCRRLLELNGAAISVASAEGKGSVFSIRFPSHEAPLRATQPRVAEVGAPRRSLRAQFSF